jgi:hypothetical protein
MKMSSLFLKIKNGDPKVINLTKLILISKLIFSISTFKKCVLKF